MSPQYYDGNDKLDSTARHKIKDDDGHDDNKSYVMISTLTSTFDKNLTVRHKTKDNDGHDNYPIVRIATPASVSDKARRKTKDNEGHDNYPYVNITTPTSASDKNSTARHKTNGHDNNPYCQVPTPTAAPDKRSRDKVFEVLNRCGKKVEDVTRIAGGIKDHLKFSPSIREAAMARLAQGTKMVVEGGPERVFQREFGILAAEKLVDSFACYISTTTGPVTGMLYVSNKRIAFCSDYAIRLPTSAGGTGVPAYYKVVLEFGKISSISSSSNVLKPSERYVHVVPRNGPEFWFMGFVSYNDAINCLNKASSVASVSCN